MRLPLQFVALVALVACSSADPALPRACTPGAQVACACPGGVQGVQVCTADGAGLDACVCPDAGGGDVLAVADAPAVDAVAPEDRPAPMDTFAVVDAPGTADAPDVVDVVDAADVVDVVDVPGDRGAAADAGPLMCSTGHANCDGNAANGCETNIAESANNCGMCGRVCTGQRATFRCASGACAVDRCEPGWLDCDRLSGNGCETEGLSNRANCGACGRACAASEACRDGACVGCPGGCGVDERCVLGMCERCPSGMLSCGNTCRDITTDRANCGACGASCPSPPGATIACIGGACVRTACVAGTADCDGNSANGCETNTASDRNNCGACGRVCGAGMGCAGGTCQCVNTSDNLCEGRCFNVNDPAHCGRCGNPCSDREFCAGMPAPVCVSCGIERPGQMLRRCENRCVDLAGDNSNCGTCGNTCTGTRACFSGVCR